jgi:hypothetical protein
VSRLIDVARFLVILTDIRPLTADGRNERVRPERRRQVVGATSREAAERIATAFAALGRVRAGRQRVKVIALGRTGKRRPDGVCPDAGLGARTTG